MQNSLRPLVFSYPQKEQPSEPPEPLPDLLRADDLYSPYYGAPPVDYLSASGDPATREQLLEHTRARERELRGLHALLNATAPINCLPLELLVEIFTHVQNSGGLLPDMDWLVVLYVCRRWFACAATTPRLWNAPMVGGSTNLLCTALARSKSLELTLELRRNGENLLQDVLKLLAPHACRLTHLHFGRLFSSGSISQVLAFLHTQVTPALQSIELRTDSGIRPSSSDAPFCFSSDKHPRFRNARLSHLSILSPMSTFSQLRVLAVSGDKRQDTGLSLNALFAAIRSLENIEELVLYDISFPTHSEIIPPPNGDRVLLHRLQTCRLFLEPPVLRQFLREFIIPPLAEGFFVASSARQPPMWQDVGIPHILPEDTSCLPALSLLEQASVRALSLKHFLGGATAAHVLRPGPTSDSIWLSVDYAGPTMFGDDDEIDVFHLLDPLAFLRRFNPPLKELMVQTSPELAGNIDWRATFMSLPQLSRLEIRVHGVSSTPFVVSLFKALGTETGEAPCAGLRQVRIEGYRGRSDAELRSTIVKSLERRRAALGRGNVEVLDELSLRIVGHHNYGQEEFSKRKSAFEDTLAPLVTRVNFRV